jgi:tRNA nucleotidyltransferase/poly(A) polymerase
MIKLKGLLTENTIGSATVDYLSNIIKNSPFKGQVFVAGGYVRDEIMGLESKDLDIVVELDGGSKELTEAIYNLVGDGDIISRPMQMGASYPIWQLTFKGDITLEGLGTFNTSGAVVEFADTMTESYPDSESRQREVRFASLKEDIERRGDFKMVKVRTPKGYIWRKVRREVNIEKDAE